jgi:hypothetical protein
LTAGFEVFPALIGESAFAAVLLVAATFDEFCVAGFSARAALLMWRFFALEPVSPSRDAKQSWNISCKRPTTTFVYELEFVLRLFAVNRSYRYP